MHADDLLKNIRHLIKYPTKNHRPRHVDISPIVTERRSDPANNYRKFEIDLRDQRATTERHIYFCSHSSIFSPLYKDVEGAFSGATALAYFRDITKGSDRWIRSLIDSEDVGFLVIRNYEFHSMEQFIQAMKACWHGRQHGYLRTNNGLYEDSSQLYDNRIEYASIVRKLLCGELPLEDMPSNDPILLKFWKSPLCAILQVDHPEVCREIGNCSIFDPCLNYTEMEDETGARISGRTNWDIEEKISWKEWSYILQGAAIAAILARSDVSTSLQRLLIDNSSIDGGCKYFAGSLINQFWGCGWQWNQQGISEAHKDASLEARGQNVLGSAYENASVILNKQEKALAEDKLQPPASDKIEST